MVTDADELGALERDAAPFSLGAASTEAASIEMSSIEMAAERIVD